MAEKTAVAEVSPLEEFCASVANARPIELSVIIPTLNERENVREVVNRLAACLGTIAWEVIFVDDDSADGTAELIRVISRGDPRVRCLHRLGRRGLSSACIEGMLASSAPYLAVMDGDLQHDETLLVPMLELLRNDPATDIAVGSRYIEGASVCQFEQTRAEYSRFATALSKRLLRVKLADPLSGFFVIRRVLLQQTMHRLSGIGFKILLDIVASAQKPLQVTEFPYKFRIRHAGESKLDSHAVLDFLMLLLDKRIGRSVPARFLLFALVGGTGVFVHLLVLLVLFKGLNIGFIFSQSAATLVAMTSNFILHNMVTYRDKRLRGCRWWKGLAIFILICSVGAFANVGVAASLFRQHTFWLISAAAGIMVGVVWNYAVSAIYTWNET